MPETLCLLVCTIIRPEVDALLAQEHWDDVVVESFPAHCGLSPLSPGQIEAVTSSLGDVDRIEVLGSSCLCRLTPRDPSAIHVHRLPQCFELVATEATVAAHLAAGAYLLTPGWLRDWRAHLSEWGFTQTQARSFFKEFAKQLVLLDTGIDSEAQARLQTLARFVNLPHAIEVVGLETLRTVLQDIVGQWAGSR